MKCTACSVVFLVALFPIALFAYDDKSVHPAINENAAKEFERHKITVLTGLGFADGLDEKLQGGNDKLSIKDWIKKGGTDEDNGLRYLSHFHDPLKSWSQAGLWGNDSALVWAQRSDQSIFGTYSWVTARDSFYQALTTGSETKFATTFRSLGQVMHLVSDMAVPAHVRNDPHPFSDSYEDWTTEHQKEFQYVNNTPVDLTVFSNPASSAVGPLPISALWDQDIYDGSNPDRLWSINAGLAEFTNANFLSGDTFGKYPHPNFADPGLFYEIQWHDRPTVMAEDSKADSPAYIWRLVGGQQKYRLAAANYFAIETEDGGFNKTLDDEVNKDYARELIPRAIGYSTALLDYFFRGDIDLKPGSAGGYALVNNTSENMAGTFAVYYDDTSGTRRKLVEWAGTTVPANGQTQVGSIAIPADHANPAKYFLVFKGTMGREAGAVAGKKVSLTSPMSPVVKISLGLSSQDNYGNWGAFGNYMAIFWDFTNNRPLTVPKAGGGAWKYPLTQAEAEGAFLDDLVKMFGETMMVIVSANELISKVSNGLDSPLKIAGQNYFNPSGNQNYIKNPVEFFNAVSRDLEIMGDPVSLSETSNDTDEAANVYGGIDIVSINETSNWSGTQVKNTVIATHNGLGGYGAAAEEVWTTGPKSSYGSVLWTDNVSAPNGGFYPPSSVMRAGLYSNVIFPSLGFDDCLLRSKNNSGATDYPYGVGVEWTGSGAEEFNYEYQRIVTAKAEIRDAQTLGPINEGLGCRFQISLLNMSNPSVNYNTNCYPNRAFIGGWTQVADYDSSLTGSYFYHGSGQATLPNGSTYPVSMSQDILISAGSGGSLKVNGINYGVSWSSILERSADYLFRAVSVASDYSVARDKNYQIVIIAESISSGNKTSLGGPADFPTAIVAHGVTTWYWDWPTVMHERELEINPTSPEYKITAIGSLCDNADTQSPWELGTNTALTSALEAMTTAMLVYYPTPNESYSAQQQQFGVDRPIPNGSYPGQQLGADRNFWKLNFSINPVVLQ